MHQSTTPALSQTIWPRWVSRQFLTLPIVQTLLPVTFAYSLSSEAVVMGQLGDERGCDEGHWHAHTRGLRWGLPEVVGMVQQVHCSRRRLLQSGLEFHVCTINKSAHTKKVWKLITYQIVKLSYNEDFFISTCWIINYIRFQCLNLGCIMYWKILNQIWNLVYVKFKLESFVPCF